jgi:hypothetical protein
MRNIRIQFSDRPAQLQDHGHVIEASEIHDCMLFAPFPFYFPIVHNTPKEIVIGEQQDQNKTTASNEYYDAKHHRTP